MPATTTTTTTTKYLSRPTREGVAMIYYGLKKKKSEVWLASVKQLCSSVNTR
jgi:hypothetical protein